MITALWRQHMEQFCHILLAFSETCDFFLIFQNQSAAGDVILQIKALCFLFENLFILTFFNACFIVFTIQCRCLTQWKLQFSITFRFWLGQQFKLEMVDFLSYAPKLFSGNYFSLTFNFKTPLDYQYRNIRTSMENWSGNSIYSRLKIIT